MMTAQIPEGNEWRFTSPGRLAFGMSVKMRNCQCLAADTGCYVLLQGARASMLNRTDKAFVHYGIQGQVKFTYEYYLEGLIKR